MLIVGGGAVAIEKLNSLMPLTGADIHVVSPVVKPEIQELAEQGLIHWEAREFRDEDVEPAHMVIAATDDPELNERVYRRGNERMRLSNSVDDPVNCNFIMSAITRSGPMQVAVSSAGCSPALAQRVRNRIASEILTKDIGILAEFVGDRRPLVKSRLPGYKVRQTFWERVIASEVPEHLSRGDHDEAENLFHQMLSLAVADAPSDFALPVGKVYLIGAGPGDPELITLRAVRVLQRAHVVLYDRLTHPDLLDHAPGNAERVYVGKEVNHPGKGRQKVINDLMVEHAKLGRTVVRLKGGDPFVFGRGGEELLALKAHGIEFEVIPGVSSAVAAPAAAHIPVTHRGISNSFAVFAGQEAEGRDEVPWDAAAKIPTAVFLMGVERLPQIVVRLKEFGRHGETPVAIVSNATHRKQSVVTGTLDTIVNLAVDIAPPATIIVGDVVSVREKLIESHQISYDSLVLTPTFI